MFKQLRKTLSLILCFAMLLSLLPQVPIWATAQEVETISEPESVLPATEGTCGENITWELMDGYYLIFSGYGLMEDYGSSNEVPWAYYRDVITQVGIQDGITNIGDYAFWGLTNLESIYIPVSVLHIGDYAFYDCSSLRKLSFPGDPPAVGEHSFDDVTAVACRSCHSPFWSDEVQKNFGGNLRWVEHLYDLRDVTYPTCIQNQVEYGSCPDCYKMLQVLLPGTILGHDYSQGEFCSRCGSNEGPINGPCGDNLYWELQSGQYLIFSGYGFMEDYGSADEVPWAHLRDVITQAGIQDGITNIGDYALWGLTKLESVYIPASVFHIGDYAFYDCTGLHEIPFQGNPPTIGENSFGNVTGVVYHPCGNWEWTEEIKESFGENLKWFGHYLSGWEYTDGTCTQNMVRHGYCDTCREYFEVEIPGTAKGHDYSYGNCFYCGMGYPVQSGVCGDDVRWGLDEQGVLTIYGQGPMWDYDLDNPAPWSAYREQINGVYFQEGVTTVGNYAFYQCDRMSNMDISNTVTSIGVSAFQDCRYMSSVYIAGSLTSIGEAAFRNCGFYEIEIPDSLEYIGPSAFADCIYLSSVYTQEGLPMVSDAMFQNCQNLYNVSLRYGMTSIGAYAFEGCNGLGWIDIPQSVTAIGERAFADCCVMYRIDLPDYLETLGDYAFANCYYLAEINFGYTAPVIAENAFYQVTGLATHSCRNPQWTGDLEQSYGGNITWVGHDFYLSHSDVATCTENEILYGSCSDCGAYVAVEIPGSALGHDFSWGDYCNRCSAVRPVANGMCGDNITWVLDAYGILNLSGTGDMWDFSYDTSPSWSEYRWQIQYVQIDYGITNISNYAFYECSMLGMIDIPESVTEIGDYAFCGCSYLYEITIPGTVNRIGEHAFEFCGGLYRVTICEGVTEIGDYAFSWCSYLNDVTVSGTVTEIGSYAFSYCENLYELSIAEGVSSIGSYAFTGCARLEYFVLPSSVTNIGESAFEVCHNLRYVTISGNDVSVGSRAFANCGSLSEFVFSGNISQLGDQVFSGCMYLYRVDIGGNVETIGADAFYDCGSLTNITIDGDVGTIEEGVFSSRWWLTDFVVHGKIDTVGNYAFSSCENLTNFTVDGGITNIGDGAFFACHNLTDITFLKNTTSIGSYAFGECIGLTDIIIPEGVSYIGHSAFQDCEYLTSVTFPESLTQIEDWAFADCINLKKLVFLGSAPSIGDFCFEEVNASAYHRCTDTTWDWRTEGNYEGNIQWKCHLFENYTLSKPATCLWDEQQTGICPSCGETDVISIPMTALGHNFQADDRCANCQAFRTVMSGWNFEETIVWELDIMGTLTISGTGSMEFGFHPDPDYRVPPWDCYKDQITAVVIEEGITDIPERFFYEHTALTSVTLPDSVAYIGEGAFAFCSSLRQIELPEQVHHIASGTFIYCTSLTDVTFSQNVSYIGIDAFCECNSLTQITLPESLTFMGEMAFAFSGLTSVTIPGSLTKVPHDAFSSCANLTSVTICEGITTIGEYAFVSCGNLSSVTLPEGLTTIEDFAFAESASLEQITFPSTVTYLGEAAFGGCGFVSITLPSGITTISDQLLAGCEKLTTVNWPDGVMIIGDSAFANCTGLTELTIPNSVVTIEDYAFSGSGLKEITIAESVTTIGNYVFSESALERIVIPETVTSFGYGVFRRCANLTSVTILAPLTKITSYTFEDCISLKQVHIPETVTGIYGSAFDGCNSLAAIDLPEGLTSIFSDAFQDCTSLTEITIPASVTTIGAWAFYNNTALQKIVFLGSAPTIYKNCFYNVTATAFHCCSDDSWTEEAKAACGETITWKGHLFEDYIPVQDATCTKDAMAMSTCPECGAEDLVVLTTATGHQFQNGTCTSCGMLDPDYVITIPTLTLKAPTLEFKDMITVNAMFEAEDLKDVVEMGMITYGTEVETWSVENAEYVTTGTTYDVNTGRYIATSQGIHAKYLNDTIYLAVYAKLIDGSYVYSKLAGYSPIQYAGNKLETSEDVELKQLVVSMLNYAAEAQRFFSHNADQLANNGLTSEQQSLAALYTPDMVQKVSAAAAEKQGIFTNNQGFAKRMPAVSFEGAFSINYFFTPKYAPVDGITLYYWNQEDFESADVLTAENATGQLTMEGSGVGQYRCDLEGIAAKGVNDAVYVAAIYSDGTTTWSSGVLGYSIGVYCANQAAKGGAIADLAKATAVYGYHAKQFFD